MSRSGWIAAAAALLFCASASGAQDAAEFYRGKTIRMIVGFVPGGGYDVYARLIARHAPRRIPGNPAIVVENMPGAASMTSVNYVTRIGAQDGTVIGVPGTAPFFAPLTAEAHMFPDPRGLHWLPSPSSDTPVFVVWHETQVRSVADLAQHEIISGSTSKNSPTSFYGRLLAELFNAKIRIVYGYSGGTPPYVITPFPHCDSKAYITPGQYGGCLGARFDPFVLDADPNGAGFRVRNMALDPSLSAARLDQRLGLLGEFSRASTPLVSPLAAEMDVFNQQAAMLLQSGKAAVAFDLSKEPAAVRDRYGHHSWGQSHLLARRLVEAGTRFVTTVNGPSITWDTHKDNFNGLKNRLVPPMEKAYAALLDDRRARVELARDAIVLLLLVRVQVAVLRRSGIEQVLRLVPRGLAKIVLALDVIRHRLPLSWESLEGLPAAAPQDR